MNAEKLLKEIEAAITELEQSALRAPVAEYSSYRELCGRRAGLVQARELLLQLMKGEE